MTKKEMLSEKYAYLRWQAEERVKKWSNGESNAYENLHQVIHELKIHLAEQEILNEELKLLVEKRYEKDGARFDLIYNHFFGDD